MEVEVIGIVGELFAILVILIVISRELNGIRKALEALEKKSE